MLAETFPDQEVSGRTFAKRVKDAGGSLSHSHFSNILRGEVTDVSEETLRALGLGFGVDWRYFKDESEVEADVVAGLQFLAEKRSGVITGLAGRGISDAGVPADLLQLALSLVDKEKRRRAEQAADETSSAPRVR
ncbi:hypothetical protein [Streptomyces kronopolitis]|uniref:hypothetical protein n=1 Tax=Streptomyces kronopolitis TaxID=1612435 RepID=UPI003D9694B3